MTSEVVMLVVVEFESILGPVAATLKSQYFHADPLVAFSGCLEHAESLLKVEATRILEIYCKLVK